MFTIIDWFICRLTLFKEHDGATGRAENARPASNLEYGERGTTCSIDYGERSLASNLEYGEI